MIRVLALLREYLKSNKLLQVHDSSQSISARRERQEDPVLPWRLKPTTQRMALKLAEKREKEKAQQGP